MVDFFEHLEHFFSVKIDGKEYPTLDELPIDDMKDSNYLQFVDAMVELIYDDWDKQRMEKLGISWPSTSLGDRKAKAKEKCKKFVKNQLYKKEEQNAKNDIFNTILEKGNLKDALDKNKKYSDKKKQKFADELWENFIVPLLRHKTVVEKRPEDVDGKDPQIIAFIKVLKTISKKESDKIAVEAIKSRGRGRNGLLFFFAKLATSILREVGRLTMLNKVPYIDKFAELGVVVLCVLTFYLSYSMILRGFAPKVEMESELVVREPSIFDTLKGVVYSIPEKIPGYSRIKKAARVYTLEDLTVTLSDLGVVGMKEVLLFNEKRLITFGPTIPSSVVDVFTAGKGLDNSNKISNSTIYTKIFFQALDTVAPTITDPEVVAMLRNPRFSLEFIREFLIQFNKVAAGKQRNFDTGVGVVKTIEDVSSKKGMDLMIDAIATIADFCVAFKTAPFTAGHDYLAKTGGWLKENWFFFIKTVTKNVIKVKIKLTFVDLKERIQTGLIIEFAGIVQSWVILMILQATAMTMTMMVEEKKGSSFIIWLGRKNEVLLRFYTNVQLVYQSFLRSLLGLAGVTAIDYVRGAMGAQSPFIDGNWVTYGLFLVSSVLGGYDARSGRDLLIGLIRAPFKVVVEMRKEIEDYLRRRKKTTLVLVNPTREGRGGPRRLLETTLKF